MGLNTAFLMATKCYQMANLQHYMIFDNITWRWVHIVEEAPVPFEFRQKRTRNNEDINLEVFEYLNRCA